MRTISRQAIGVAVGAFATAFIAIGPAAAADMPLEPAPGPEYTDGEAYPVQPPVEQGYGDYAPRVYGEVAPPPVVYAPPPVVYYAPPPAIVVPPPVYYARPYAYRVPAYVVARRGPYVVRGVARWSGPHPHRW